MKRRTLFALTAATLAVALSGCASMRRNQLADELRTALGGDPVNIVVENDTITMSSSADYLYLKLGACCEIGDRAVLAVWKGC